MNQPENKTKKRLPVGQQLVRADKWPTIGEKNPAGHIGDWQLSICGHVKHENSWSIDQLRKMPQTELVTDIHCVTRWSKFDMKFSGVLLQDLLELCHVGESAQFVSFIAKSERDHSTSLSLVEAIELGTLVALDFKDEPLPVDHGGPLRTIVPGKYFYKSLKWLTRIELLAEDRLGFWESDSGYHNNADPWLEQRYIASSINKQEAAKLIKSRDFSDRDLRSLNAGGRDLNDLNAEGALLRNADFSKSQLLRASFRGANLSNAHFRFSQLSHANFENADLEGADFTGADLRGANLSNASLFGSSFFARENPEQGALIDDTTVLPSDFHEVLTPEQTDYIRDKLSDQ